MDPGITAADPTTNVASPTDSATHGKFPTKIIVPKSTIPFSRCYVGPAKEQWRKCSEKYHPYNNQMIQNKKDHFPSPHSKPQPYNTWYKEKPFRPPYYHSSPGLEAPLHARPNLHQYEQIFDNQFLDPPKPGGLAQLKTLPRHWPVSYLHKETPPNAANDSQIYVPKDTKNSESIQNQKYDAIEKLMETIKTEGPNETSTESSRPAKIIKDQPSKEEEEELLLVRIPMTESPREKPAKSVTLEIVDTNVKNGTRLKKLDKSLDFDDLFLISLPKRNKTNSVNVTNRFMMRSPKRDLQVFPIRRGYVTRTSRTNIRKRRVLKPDIET